MSQEWTQSTTVHEGGKIELVLPTLAAGEEVEVTIRRRVIKTKETVLAALAEMKLLAVKGAHISDDDLRRDEIYPDRA